jgi:homocysteine S-methyltransferase
MQTFPTPMILDGGLSNELEALGHDLNHPLWSARLLKDNPRAIVDAHLNYFRAGADCVITSSYQASLDGLREAFGIGSDEAAALLVRTTELAIQARAEYLAENLGRPLFVAASVGPYGAVLHDGSEYRGDYALSQDELTEFHRARLDILAGTGADLLACETIPSGQEVGVLALLLSKYNKPAWVSCSCRDGEHLNDGTPLAEVAARLAEVDSVFAVGVNCTAPQHVSSLVRIIRKAAPRKRVVVYPNSGEVYHAEPGTWSGFDETDHGALMASEWHSLGADIIGGCCRIGPDQITAIRKAVLG